MSGKRKILTTTVSAGNGSDLGGLCGGGDSRDEHPKKTKKKSVEKKEEEEGGGSVEREVRFLRVLARRD